MIYICIRKPVDWANQTEFWSQLPREFRPTIEVWNRSFNIPYHQFRQRVREISRLNIAAVRNAVSLNWSDVPDGELVLPVMMMIGFGKCRDHRRKRARPTVERIPMG